MHYNTIIAMRSTLTEIIEDVPYGSDSLRTLLGCTRGASTYDVLVMASFRYFRVLLASYHNANYPRAVLRAMPQIES